MQPEDDRRIAGVGTPEADWIGLEALPAVAQVGS